VRAARAVWLTEAAAVAGRIKAKITTASHWRVLFKRIPQ
jgi:hypothetical protein